MINRTGIPDEKLISKIIPSMERMLKGPVAVVECFQEIPCNPCSTVCKSGAIEVGENINNTPSVYHEKCNGCGLCVSCCPGLAIFIIDMSYSKEKCVIKIPYEFLPLPEEGSIVTALDRGGNPCGSAKVLKVQKIKHYEKTPLVWLEVDKKLFMDVRNFRMGES